MEPLFNKFSSHLKETLVTAHLLAKELHQDQVQPIHLLYALYDQPGALAAELLRKTPLELSTLRAIIEQQPAGAIDTTEPRLNKAAQDVLTGAATMAFTHKHNYIGTEHLLASLLQNNDDVIKTLWQKLHLNNNQLNKQLKAILRGTSKFSDITSASNDDDSINQMFKMVPPELENRDNDEGSKILEKYGLDLTEQGRQNKLDPVIGRELEIERLIQILSRRTKNNPVLLGQAGVGKTAIIEGLAKRISEEQVPDVLLGKKIVALDLGATVAGTMYRGEFEQRLKKLIKEVKNDPNIILFIDELHTLVGAGSASGAMDAANLLKPALARGELRCIGATTEEEYKRYIENDPALERRFQPIRIAEATPQETLDILQGIRERYEEFHNVGLTNEALQAAVDLSHRYLSGKFLPDKAIDLIDEAAAKIKVQQTKDVLQRQLRQQGKKLAELSQAKAEAILNQKYDQALKLRTEEQKLFIDIERKRGRLHQKKQRRLGTVTAADIATLVAKISGIPVQELLTDERQRLLTLEQRLHQHIIGQEDALKIIAESVRRQRAGLAHPNRPISSFMFLGPSGVGKTATAKALAVELFDDPATLIRIDMGEFGQEFQASKLIGAPAGYVGYRDSTTLADAVRRRPYSVVLFDEVEKAHPEIFNLLLPVLDEGFLTDATGTKVDFRNTIIIMTANVGTTELTNTAALGFDRTSAAQTKVAQQEYERLKEKILGSLGDCFRPEFINRLDHLIVFRPLLPAHATQIAELQLQQLTQRLQEQNIKLQIKPGVTKLLGQLGFSNEEGARGINRIIQRQIEHVLAEGIIAEQFKNGDTINVEAKRQKIVINKINHPVAEKLKI